LYKEFCELKTIELCTKNSNLRSSLELVQVDLQEAMQDGGVATQGGQYKAMTTKT
jgi:predicted metal-binding protein